MKKRRLLTIVLTFTLLLGLTSCAKVAYAESEQQGVSKSNIEQLIADLQKYFDRYTGSSFDKTEVSPYYEVYCNENKTAGIVILTCTNGEKKLKTKLYATLPYYSDGNFYNVDGIKNTLAVKELLQEQAPNYNKTPQEIERELATPTPSPTPIPEGTPNEDLPEELQQGYIKEDGGK